MKIKKEISVNESGLSIMCRLCLSKGVPLLDIFRYSPKMNNRVADVIMKRASVQITRCDEIPNFICQSCYTQLEETHQFLMKIERSDRTLRCYLQQLNGPDKPINAKSSVQPSQNRLFSNFNESLTVKCESLELNDVSEMDLTWREAEPVNVNEENKNNEEMSLKSEIKDELVDDYLFLPTERASVTEEISCNVDDKEFSCEDLTIEIGATKVGEDMTVNWKEKEQENHILTNKFMEEMSLKSEIKSEKIDNNLSILEESVDDAENVSSNGDINEISCETTKISISKASENSCLRSVNVTGNFSTCEETNKNTPINRKKHQKANKFKCDICNICFSWAHDLRYHKRMHTGEKLFHCDVCSKCFTHQSNLRKHTRIHTGEKPYQCDICNKEFSQSSHLKSHKFKHTGEKPYSCDFCEKCFTQSSHLKRHMLRHTGEKPFQCDVCSKWFSQQSNLSKHKRMHTGEKPY